MFDSLLIIESNQQEMKALTRK